MKTYRGGEQVKSGIYWNLATGELAQGEAHGGVLPGEVQQRYIRVPGPLVLALGPVAGAIFVIFLPVMGVVGFLAYLARKLAQLAVPTAQAASRVLLPSWVPGVSYLIRRREGKARKAAEKQEPARGKLDETMTELEKELRERREKGEK